MGRVVGNEGVERRKEEVGGKGETASQRGEKGEGLEVANMQLTSRLARSLESQVIRKLTFVLVKFKNLIKQNYEKEESFRYKVTISFDNRHLMAGKDYPTFSLSSLGKKGNFKARLFVILITIFIIIILLRE